MQNVDDFVTLQNSMARPVTYVLNIK